MDLTFGLGTLGAVILGVVLLLVVRGKVARGITQGLRPDTRKLMSWIVIIYIVAVMATGGWFSGILGAPSPQETVIPADYKVTVSESQNHVTADDTSNTVTVLLDRSATAWESGTQYLNVSWTCTRVDAGTADSTIVFSVVSVDTWMDTSGYTRYTLAKYSNGEYYADWNASGSSVQVNGQMSIMIDRETTSSATAMFKAVADLTSWLTENVGDTHTVIIKLSDIASGWSETWTINYILTNTS